MPTDTFQIAAGADDQIGTITGATYPPTGFRSFNAGLNEAFSQRSTYNNEFHVWNGLWRWDTSALPDNAVITSAKVIFILAGWNNDDNRNAVFDWHDWSALSTANDIAVDAPTTNLAASLSIASVTSLGPLTLTLSDADANVSRTGYTYLRGHTSGGQPAGENRIIPRAFEGSTTDSAKLEVDYTIPSSPTTATFQVASTSETLLLRREGATWPPTGALFRSATSANVFPGKNLQTGPNYQVENALARWDTSAIPDGDTILSATLRVTVTARTDTNSRSVVGEWYTFDGSDGDHSMTALGGAVSATTIASIPATGVYDFPLENVFNVNKQGFTGIRLHVTGDEPTGINRMVMAAGAIVDSPTLIVEHETDTTPPAAPTGLAATVTTE